jgi:uncharacterized membrane protein
VSRLGGGAIAAALRYGTLVSVAVIGIGFAWALVQGGAGASGRGVVELIGSGGADGLMASGLLGLTLVPIVVVALAAAGAAGAGERHRAVQAAAVLLLLLASLATAALIGAAPG